ncbi:MAG: hypothetical protein GQF41_0283 [Candidatus Rifleibacterium amylolyticum]|nr:MAG: hypothetical protein GQF41_0283 [Candidatus Rifleibacterium amylolyticum]NLF95803.1 hypothetical protein [Candidatus Riflebacteria bacterium]
MIRRFSRQLILMASCCFLLPAGLALGWGVDADSIVEKVQVGAGKNAQQYVLMNSRLNEHQWYCARLTPSLVETGQGKNIEPDLTLIRFQKTDPDNPEKLREGGILQFSFSIGADNAAMNALKKKLPRGVDKKLARVAPLPLSGIEMTIFDPHGRKIALVATSSQGIAADYASQYARFSAVFSKVDADLIDTLLNSKTGVKYELTYRYSTLSRPLTSNVRVDLDKIAGKARKLDDSQLVSAENGQVDVEMLRYLRRQVNNPRAAQRLRIAASSRMPAVVATASAHIDARDLDRKVPKTTSRSTHSPRISQSVQNVTLVHRSRAQKYLAAQGFISLSDYSPEVRQKKIIEDTGYENWKYAYLIMPTIGDLPDLRIDRISMKVTLTDGKHKYEMRDYEWTPEHQWLDITRAPAAIARFYLNDLISAGPKYYEKAFFRLEYSIIAGDSPPVTGSDEIPVFTGDMPLATPLELADVMMFDFSNLCWDAPESDKTRLLKAEVIIQDGKRRIRQFVAPFKRADKITIYPELVPVLLTRGSFDKPNGVKVSVFFSTADNKRVSWDFNGMDLREAFPSAWLSFYDNDWQQN